MYFYAIVVYMRKDTLVNEENPSISLINIYICLDVVYKMKKTYERIYSRFEEFSLKK